jgi:hypothetical protein
MPVKASTVRASVPGVTEMVESITQRRSYFASVKGVRRLLILGLTPILASSGYVSDYSLHVELWRGLTDADARGDVGILFNNHFDHRQRLVIFVLQRKDDFVFGILEPHGRLERIVEVVIEPA